MFDFFAKKFVENSEDYQKPTVRLELISLSSIIVIAINLLLVIMKLIVGYSSNSTAIINDGFNNLADSVVALMAYMGSKLSKKPADSEHPHGHGRSEQMGSLFVSMLIIYMGAKLFLNSISQFKAGSSINITSITLLVLVLSILAKVYIFRLNQYLFKKLDSDLNLGVMVDARNDIFMTSMIILGSMVHKYVNFNLDAALGVFLAVIIIIPGFGLFRESSSYLMGKRVSQDIIDQIGHILLDSNFIVGYHNLEIHDYGKGHMDGSVDVEIAENLSLLVAHYIITEKQKRIWEEAEVKMSIHMDPTFTLIIDEDLETKIKKLERKARDEYEDF